MTYEVKQLYGTKMRVKIDCYLMAFKSDGKIYKSQPCTRSPYLVNTKLVVEVPFSLPWLEN